MLDTDVNAVGTLTVGEYLTTPFHPDVDYVDGQIEERAVGERDHGELQFRVAVLLKRLKLFPYIETRLQVAATRFRIPDVSVYSEKPNEQVFTRPPLICIEILSPEDRVSRVLR